MEAGTAGMADGDDVLAGADVAGADVAGTDEAVPPGMNEEGTLAAPVLPSSLPPPPPASNVPYGDACEADNGGGAAACGCSHGRERASRNR